VEVPEAREDHVLGGRPGSGPSLKRDSDRGRNREPDGAVRPGVRDILIAHALSEGSDRAEDVRVRVGRHERAAWPDETLVDREVGTDPPVDVVDRYAAGAPEAAAELLVRRVLLVGPAGVAVEGEEGLLRVLDPEAVVLDVLDDVGAAEVPRDPGVDGDVDDVTGRGSPTRVRRDDLLDDG